MIPLRQTIKRETFPWIILSLIVLNIILFFHQLSLGDELKGFIESYGAIPANFFSLEKNHPDEIFLRFFPILSSLFLHGGWLHLLGNMWFLWIFGGNVEDRMGHFRFLFFYLGCGIAGSLAHIYLNFDSLIPTIGASGAISGVLGAYFLLYPFSRILTLLPIFFFFTFVQLPAFLFLGLWFLVQLFSGAFSILSGETIAGRIAWWAHIGGFVAGVVLLPFFLVGRKRNMD